jgi:hypothetical protein
VSALNVLTTLAESDDVELLSGLLERTTDDEIRAVASLAADTARRKATGSER